MVSVSTKSKLKPFLEASEKRINGKIGLTSNFTSVLLEFYVYSRERKLLLIFKKGEIEGSDSKIFTSTRIRIQIEFSYRYPDSF